MKEIGTRREDGKLPATSSFATRPSEALAKGEGYGGASNTAGPPLAEEVEELPLFGKEGLGEIREGVADYSKNSVNFFT